jgi:Condensation domain/TubC N-terminal docking domain
LNTSELLLRAAKAGVVFWLEGDRLAYRAPRLGMTDELRAEIIGHKADLIALLRKNRLGGPVPLRSAPARRSQDGTSPLASGQERLWLIERRLGPSPLYNVHFRLAWKGVLDREALALAIRDTVARHAVLRTAFSESDGTVSAVACAEDTVELVHLDLRDQDPAARASAADDFIAGHQRAPFDLERGPLLRTAVITLAGDDHIVLVTQHHIITDGWSLRIFLAELGQSYLARYLGRPGLPPEPESSFTYEDFARLELQWRGEQFYSERRTWWKEHLDGLSPLPVGRAQPAPATVADYSGAVLEFAVPPLLAAGLEDLAQAQDCTLYTVLLTVWSILLYRYTRQPDFVIGTVTSGRDQPEFQDVLGFFANTVVLRCDLSGHPDVTEAIRRIRRETEEVFEREIPFADIVMASGVHDSGLTPLIQAAFMFPNFREPAFLSPADAARIDARVSVEARIDGSVEGTTKFGLMLTMQKSGSGLEGCLEYATAQFSPEAARRMTDHFLALARSVVQHPEQAVSRLNMMSADERRQLLVDWNKH